MIPKDVSGLSDRRTAPAVMRRLAADLSLAADLLEQANAAEPFDKVKSEQAAEIMAGIMSGVTAYGLSALVERAMEQAENEAPVSGPVH